MSDFNKFAQHLPPEQQAIRRRCFHPIGSFNEFTTEDTYQSIPARFERIVEQYPDRIALRTMTQGFTYEALNKTANRVARALLANCGTGEQLIAVLLKHDPAMIVGILGAFKTGKICVPLDPAYHEVRTSYILNECQAKLVVTDSENFSLARQLVQGGAQVINIDEIKADLSDENIGIYIAPDACSYILYTSGSTAQPKGVVQSHRNLLYDVRSYTNSLHICADDRLTLFASCSGGEGMKNALSGLLNGATICQWNIKQEGFAVLANWLIDEDITIWISTPTIFRNFVTTLSTEKRFANLRLIRLGSGTVHKTDVELYRDYFSPECVLVNWLASTEVGNFANYFIDGNIQITGDTVPVGYSVEGKEVLLLDDNGQRLAVNQVGEIAVKSRYLSSGYWGKPDLTRSKFLPDSDGGEERTYLTGDLGRMHPDGCLEYLGRKDLQVKIRGYSLEIAAVERALLELPTVEHAVVVARNDSGDQRLVAYLVPSVYPDPAVSELRKLLKAKLPDYMMPSAFVFLERLPLAPNGKIDQKALPTPDRHRPQLEEVFVAPRTPVEEIIAEIWSDFLKLDLIGIHDNFFDLGGHSLLATQIVSRVLQTLQVELPMGSFFEAPTIAGLAKLIETIHWSRQVQQSSIGSKKKHEQGEI